MNVKRKQIWMAENNSQPICLSVFPFACAINLWLFDCVAERASHALKVLLRSILVHVSWLFPFTLFRPFVGVRWWWMCNAINKDRYRKGAAPSMSSSFWNMRYEKKANWIVECATERQSICLVKKREEKITILFYSILSSGKMCGSATKNTKYVKSEKQQTNMQIILSTLLTGTERNTAVCHACGVRYLYRERSVFRVQTAQM